MAKSKVYAVYDAKVKYYQFPVFLRNNAEALRMWSDTANKADHPCAQHPSDFDFHELGEFDDQTGQIEMLKTPNALGLAIHYKDTLQPTPLFNQK